MLAIAPTVTMQVPAASPALSATARNYTREASAANTRRAYGAAWQNFVTWLPRGH